MRLLSPPRFPALASFPSGAKGDAVVDNSTGILYVHDGAGWRSVVGTGSGIVYQEGPYLMLGDSILANPTGPAVIRVGSTLDQNAYRDFLAYSSYEHGRIPVQASRAHFRCVECAPGTGNAFTASGFTPTKTGTWTTPALATTNQRTRTLRNNIPTATTAGSSSGVHYATNWLSVGGGANGGFFYRCIFGLSTMAAGARFFVGLRAATALIGNVEPSTLTNFVGVGINSTHTGNLRLYSAGATAQAAIDLGASFPISTTTLYQLTLTSGYGIAGTVEWSLVNLGTAAEDSRQLTTNLPSGYIAPTMWVNNGALASAQSIDLAQIYTESRYAA